MWRCFLWLLLCLVLIQALRADNDDHVEGLSDSHSNREDTAVAVTPSIQISFPPNHSVWQVSSSHATLFQLELHFVLRDFEVPKHGFVQLQGTKIDPRLYYHQNASTCIVLRALETGTYFVSLQLVDRDHRPLDLSKSHALVHFEVVAALSRSEAQVPSTSLAPVYLMNLPRMSPSTSNHRRSNAVTPVCIVASTAALLDGQKKMWLQVLEHLMPLQEFRFAMKTFDGEIHDGAFTQALRKLNVPIDNMPLRITVKELMDHGLDASSQSDIMDFVRAHAINDEQSATTAVGGNDNVLGDAWDQDGSTRRPAFVTRFLDQIKSNLRSCSGGILVLANAREDSDEIVISSARQVGIHAIVMELANLNPSIDIHIDVLLAPSHFALWHPSIQSKVYASSQFVFSTGIDTHVFHPPPDKVVNSSSWSLPLTRPMVVGFVGRIAMEKSLGLTLVAAKLLMEKCREVNNNQKFTKENQRQCQFEFRFIGDGDPKYVSELKGLASDLELVQSNHVVFMDGIYNDHSLAHEIGQFDVFVLTGFRETLCLAALEAMACGIPVVAFDGHGPMEFLDHQFNSLVVTEPTGASIRDSLWRLYSDPALLAQLSKNAVQTIQRRFRLDVQVENYKQLYRRLANHRGVISQTSEWHQPTNASTTC